MNDYFTWFLVMLWFTLNRQLCFLSRQFTLLQIESRFKKVRIRHVLCLQWWLSKYDKQERRHYYYKGMRSSPNEKWNKNEPRPCYSTYIDLCRVSGAARARLSEYARFKLDYCKDTFIQSLQRRRQPFVQMTNTTFSLLYFMFSQLL